MITWDDTIKNWVCWLLVETEDQKIRTSLMKFFLKIARKAYELHNFNTLFEIVGALMLPPIQRLVRTWKSLPTKYKAFWMV